MKKLFKRWFVKESKDTSESSVVNQDNLTIAELNHTIGELNNRVKSLEKKAWLRDNPQKFNCGERVRFEDKKCQVIEVKLHDNSIGFAWIYKLIEIDGCIIKKYKGTNYMTRDRISEEFQFESQILNKKDYKKAKKKK